MKKILALTLAFALAFCLCGCALTGGESSDPTPSEPASSNNSSSDEVSSEESSKEESSKEESSQPEAPKGEDALLVCPMEGSMYNTASITLKPDFTFEMEINLLSGFGNAKGSYEIGENKVITCNVSTVDFEGFTGDDIKAFELQPKGSDGYTIRFLDVEFVGALNDGAVFTKQ